MTVEKAIHFTMFVLLIVGLCGIGAWIIYTYAENDLLKVGGIALIWGIILLILYVCFKRLNWVWWGTSQ